MKKIGKLFLRGLLAILPVAVTLYVLYWLASTGESILGGLIRFAIGEPNYIPGMGVIAGFLVVLAVWLLLQVWLFRRLLLLSDQIMARIPGIKSIYGFVRDLIGFFDASKKKAFGKTVMIDVGDTGLRLMGLVTRETFDDLPAGIGDEQTVAVYLPMSYQLGGFTVMVPQSRIQIVDMKVDRSLQFLLTAGVTSEKNTTAPGRDHTSDAA
jgi:uncharacterized membrane protein